MLSELMSGIVARSEMIFSAAIFLSVSILTFVLANLTKSWSDVRRRSVAGDAGSRSTPPPVHSLLHEDAATGGILDALLPKNESEKTELRRFLNMAGYYGRRAPIILQLARIVTAVLLGMLTAIVYGRFFPNHPHFAVIGASLFMTLAGYLLPKSLVSFRRDALVEQHRQGFPDFLDLLVICIEAGIGIESAIKRVSGDMVRSYPSLARNLGFMSLELQTGRSTRDALGNLSVRLGIEEAKSFATLIQQSEELGSSLVQSLRVYSDEMRAKRLSRAEEKAYALPAKLVIPLGLFIFPVILGIVLTPVVIKIYKALGI